MKFKKLVEHNDHEGESWIFYYLCDNHAVNRAIDVLAAFNESIDLYSDEYDEDEVDFIVDELSGIGSYKPLANKVTIDPAAINTLLELTNLVSSDDFDEDEVCESVFDLFYKGGIFKDL